MQRIKKSILLTLLASAIVAPAGVASASSIGKAMGGKALSNNELSEVRGAYLNAGGLLIEFGMSSTTLIDGIVQRDIQFGTSSGETIDSSQIKQVIQVGDNNAQIPQEVIDGLPDMVTIIQNSEDNRVIQNITNLDVQVSNARVYFDGNLSTAISNSAIGALQ